MHACRSMVGGLMGVRSLFDMEKYIEQVPHNTYYKNKCTYKHKFTPIPANQSPILRRQTAANDHDRDQCCFEEEEKTEIKS